MKSLLMLDTTDPIDSERAVSVRSELCAFVFAAKNAAATPAILTIRSSENVETSTGGISEQPHYRFRSIFDNDSASERSGGHSYGRLKPTFRQGQDSDGNDLNDPAPDPRGR